MLASVYVKDALRSRNFVNVERIKVNSRIPSSWNLVVKVAGEDVPCEVKLEDGTFKVSEEYFQAPFFLCVLYNVKFLFSLIQRDHTY